MKPRKLTPAGKLVLDLLEDAYTCYPNTDHYPFTELPDRERVLVSDMLKCATVKNTHDISDGAAEFTRKHPDLTSVEVIIGDVETLLYKAHGLAGWQVYNGRLELRGAWEMEMNVGSSGQPPRYYLFDTPLPLLEKNDLSRFKSQIVNESSHWGRTGER